MVTIRPLRRARITALAASMPIPFAVTCTGMGLACPNGVQEEQPAITPPSAVGPASCTVCKVANLHGHQSCNAQNCPRRI